MEIYQSKKNNLKNIGIVQARMGSTRLPGKMLLQLNNHPVVSWIYLRMKRCKMLHQLVFSIPETNENNILEKSLRSMGAEVIRGSENDVLDRYIKVINITQNVIELTLGSSYIKLKIVKTPITIATENA